MSTKQRVKSFIDAGSRPVLDQKSKSFLMLKGPNRKYVQLSKNDGEPTTAGLFWQELTGEQLPQSGYMTQAAVREGNVEYIKTRDGKRAITRRLNVQNGEWIFTQLGLRYYKK